MNKYEVTVKDGDGIIFQEWLEAPHELEILGSLQYKTELFNGFTSVDIKQIEKN